MRIGRLANVLGTGRDGPVYVENHRVWKSGWRRLWLWALPYVQTGHSRRHHGSTYLSSDHDPLQQHTVAHLSNAHRRDFRNSPPTRGRTPDSPLSGMPVRLQRLVYRSDFSAYSPPLITAAADLEFFSIRQNDPGYPQRMRSVSGGISRNRYLLSVLDRNRRPPSRRQIGITRKFALPKLDVAFTVFNQQFNDRVGTDEVELFYCSFKRYLSLRI